jgi:hypothetical protein
MLEMGPLVGMIQIPGIRYGVKDVITLATLNGAIEEVLGTMEKSEVRSLSMQTEFLSQCLTAWLNSSGRLENKGRSKSGELSPENVAYQGRVLVSVITLVPAVIWMLRKDGHPLVSWRALVALTDWFREIAGRANLLENGVFIGKGKFKERGYLGSGGIARFRDSLWAAIVDKTRIDKATKPDELSRLAEKSRKAVFSGLASSAHAR